MTPIADVKRAVLAGMKALGGDVTKAELQRHMLDGERDVKMQTCREQQIGRALRELAEEGVIERWARGNYKLTK